MTLNGGRKKTNSEKTTWAECVSGILINIVINFGSLAAIFERWSLNFCELPKNGQLTAFLRFYGFNANYEWFDQKNQLYYLIICLARPFQTWIGRWIKRKRGYCILSENALYHIVIDEFVTKIEHFMAISKEEEKNNEILLLINNPINLYVILMVSNINTKWSCVQKKGFAYFCVYCIRCNKIKMGVTFKIPEKHEG